MAAPMLRSLAGHGQVLRSASAIVSKSVSGSHVLRIDGYSHLKEVVDCDEYIESCDFDVGDHIWRLRCFPGGTNAEWKDHISLFLKFVSYPQDKFARAKFQLCLLDSLGNPVLPRDSGMHKFSRGHTWGFNDFISREQLENSEYLKDDRFAIQCNVWVTTVRKCRDNWAFISQDLKYDKSTGVELGVKDCGFSS